MSDKLYGKINNIEGEIIRWRQELHKFPEIGLNLPKTSQYIKDELDKMSIEYSTLLNGNAVVGLIKGSQEGKTIAIRADMDGLPIEEATGLSFASENKNMHACGHDAHMAGLLAAAKILNDDRSNLKGNVKLIFQPGEEYPGGAKPIIEEGVLENPRVDFIIGAHVGDLSEEIPFGNIALRYGPMMASADTFSAEIIGKGCHGAYPEKGIDPIIMAADIIQSVQNIKTREIKAIDPCVISICSINSGRSKNIIPGSVEIQGTVRTFNDDVRQYIYKRLESIIKNATDRSGGSYQYDYEFRYPTLINDSDQVFRLEEILGNSILKDKLTILKEPLMGGEDMAFYLNEVPGLFFYLNNLRSVDGEGHGHHNSKFDIEEKELWKVVYAFVEYTNSYLK
nr:M20 family metallopeptidase [Tissierella sp.]